MSDESDDKEWKPFAMDGLRERLAEVQSLLRQAAALGMAQDAARAAAMTELHQQTREQARDVTGKRRYR